MKDGDIDYSRYTQREMEEALEGINPGKYPKNHENLRAAYQASTASEPPLPASEPPEDHDELETEPPPTPRYDERGRYVPNHIPASERVSSFLFSLLLLAYGSRGPGKRSLPAFQARRYPFA